MQLGKETSLVMMVIYNAGTVGFQKSSVAKFKITSVGKKLFLNYPVELIILIVGIM